MTTVTKAMLNACATQAERIELIEQVCRDVEAEETTASRSPSGPPWRSGITALAESRSAAPASASRPKPRLLVFSSIADRIRFLRRGR